MLVLVFCFLVLALLGGAYYAYRIAFYAPVKGRDKVIDPKGSAYDPYRQEMKRIYDQICDRPCEQVRIFSRDGLALSGRYYHVKDGAPLDLCFHGYRSHPFTDFSGGAELSFQMGHNLLLVDQRAHGKSEGRTITFGILERQDLACWVDYAVQRFGSDVKILLYGVSMGGATVLMASELDLPRNVKGIIADCPFVSPIEIILDVGRKSMPFFPSWLIRPFAILGARIYGGFDLLEADGSQAVRQTNIPVLILHGEADTYVPCEMSDIVSANPRLVQRHTFPGAAHGMSYLTDTPRYHRLVKAFAQKVLA